MWYMPTRVGSGPGASAGSFALSNLRETFGGRPPAEIVTRFLATLLGALQGQRVLSVGSVPLDLGRSARLASDHQFLALVRRDGGCRFPGCRLPAGWCDVDHLVAWQDGGTTDLSNLVLWCRHHHNFKHRPDVHVNGTATDLYRPRKKS